MSVSYCVGCGKKHEDTFWKHTEVETEDGKLSGWFCRQWFSPSVGMTNKQVLEYSYTPLWKIAGLKPNKQELAIDRQLKREGKTYWQKQQDTIARAKVKYDTTKLKNEILTGKIKQKAPVSYQKSSNPV